MKSVKDTILVPPLRRLSQSGAALSPQHLCTLPGSSDLVLEAEAQRYESQSQSERCSQRRGGTQKKREPEKAAPATLPRPLRPQPIGRARREKPVQLCLAMRRSSLSATRTRATRGTPLYSYSASAGGLGLHPECRSRGWEGMIRP